MLELLLVNGRSGKMPRVHIATGGRKVKPHLFVLSVHTVCIVHRLAKRTEAGMLRA